jgi:hypothetical protein
MNLENGFTLNDGVKYKTLIVLLLVNIIVG